MINYAIINDEGYVLAMATGKNLEGAKRHCPDNKSGEYVEILQRTADRILAKMMRKETNIRLEDME